jgi:hypothetical protein
MFRSSTIIRELALNLAEIMFTLKHSVKLRRYLLCGCVACFNINITLARFSASSLMMVEDRNMYER